MSSQSTFGTREPEFPDERPVAPDREEGGGVPRIVVHPEDPRMSPALDDPRGFGQRAEVETAEGFEGGRGTGPDHGQAGDQEQGTHRGRALEYGRLSPDRSRFGPGLAIAGLSRGVSVDRAALACAAGAPADAPVGRVAFPGTCRTGPRGSSPLLPAFQVLGGDINRHIGFGIVRAGAGRLRRPRGRDGGDVAPGRFSRGVIRVDAIRIRRVPASRRSE